MSQTLAPTQPAAGPPPAPTAPLCARVAIHANTQEPPSIEEVAADDPLVLIEELCERAEGASVLPAPAIREVIENLIHADFRDAVVTVADEGHTLRVSDHGPGIADIERAIEPGYSSADRRARSVVRGVGGGLPLARAMMDHAGGTLVLDANLGTGATVTLALPVTQQTPAGEPVCSETARMIMALLLEIGSGRADRLAQELGRSRAECGRELALLQHRGLACREPGGAHRLTDAGTALLATLF